MSMKMNLRGVLKTLIQRDLGDILSLLSKDPRCGLIVQARRAVVRRGMYPGYDDDESKEDHNSEMPTVDLSGNATTIHSSRWSKFMTKNNASNDADPYAATIPPSSTISRRFCC